MFKGLVSALVLLLLLSAVVRGDGGGVGVFLRLLLRSSLLLLSFRLSWGLAGGTQEAQIDERTVSPLTVHSAAFFVVEWTVATTFSVRGKTKRRKAFTAWTCSSIVREV